MQKSLGFTLIELLVVVLIIGILSAVALPQYQKAAAKSRFTQLQTAGKSLKDAMELYYMANGSYPLYWKDLDIEYSGCSEGTSRYLLWCDKFAVDMFAGETAALVLYDMHGIEANQPGTDVLSSQTPIIYTIWLDNSDSPGKIACRSKISGLCAGMGY